MSPARTRRTVAAIVAVWMLGLVLILALWQRVDASCAPGTSAAGEAGDPCAGVPTATSAGR